MYLCRCMNMYTLLPLRPLRPLVPLWQLSPPLHLELRWSEDKPDLGIFNCGLSFHALSGGRIKCINHMTNLLVDHPKGFTWENYGVKWETDHIWQYAELDWRKKWHRFKLNNFLNLQPLTPKETRIRITSGNCRNKYEKTEKGWLLVLERLLPRAGHRTIQHAYRTIAC